MCMLFPLIETFVFLGWVDRMDVDMGKGVEDGCGFWAKLERWTGHAYHPTVLLYYLPFTILFLLLPSLSCLAFAWPGLILFRSILNPTTWKSFSSHFSLLSFRFLVSHVRCSVTLYIPYSGLYVLLRASVLWSFVLSWMSERVLRRDGEWEWGGRKISFDTRWTQRR